MRLRLVCLNVWSGLNYRGLLRVGELDSPGHRESRYQALVAQLRQLEPDVVGLNEANPVEAYTSRLARDLGMTGVCYPGLRGLALGRWQLPVNLCEGDALLARPELKLSFQGRKRLTGGLVGRTFSLNFTNATQVLAARIWPEGRPLELFCTHWSVATGASDYQRVLERHESGTAQRVRLKEARGTAAWIASRLTSGQPAVLLGDLNCTPDSPELALLESSGWVDAGCEGFTWDERRNRNLLDYYPGEPRTASRIDYVLVNQPLATAVEQVKVVLDQPPHPSDHFGVLCDLVLP